MAGTSRTRPDYDFLIKLLLIGDSGEQGGSRHDASKLLPKD